MKRTILLAISLLQVLSTSAQSAATAQRTKISHSVAKTTTTEHDSLLISNLTPADTVAYSYPYGVDSGLISGINAAGHYGFAERYVFNNADSTMQVIGIAAVFVGKVNPLSTKVVDLKVWSAAGRTASSRPTLYYSGYPDMGLNSIMVPYQGLGISDSAVVLQQYYFTVPTTLSADTFFVGYTTNYMWDSLAGDTIGIATTQVGSRMTPVYTIEGADTIVNVQNATLIPIDIWRENAFDLNYNMDYWVFPIVNTTSVETTTGIKRNDFIFYGVYPNPATNVARVKFALASESDVTILLVDALGRTVQAIAPEYLLRGEYIRDLNTSSLPCGDYLCLVRTSTGDGIASRLSVGK